MGPVDSVTRNDYHLRYEYGRKSGKGILPEEKGDQPTEYKGLVVLKLYTD